MINNAQFLDTMPLIVQTWVVSFLRRIGGSGPYFCVTLVSLDEGRFLYVEDVRRPGRTRIAFSQLELFESHEDLLYLG